MSISNGMRPAIRSRRAEFRGLGNTTGPRAVLGSQRPRTSEGIQVHSNLPVSSSALRGGDGSRSVPCRPPGIAGIRAGVAFAPATCRQGCRRSRVLPRFTTSPPICTSSPPIDTPFRETLLETPARDAQPPENEKNRICKVNRSPRFTPRCESSARVRSYSCG